MSYRPELDGLRAVAVLLVVLFHGKVPGFDGGFLGVDVFFVLSGFLITTILLAQFDSSGRIAFREFYLRRALRLYPALLLMLATYLALAPLLWPDYPHLTDAALAAFYVSNYSVPLTGAPDYLRHTWSLSVEEQFYLTLPVLLLYFVRRRSPAQLARDLAICTLLAIAWRTCNTVAELPTYHRFDTRLAGLLAGCTLAAAFRAGLRPAGALVPWLGLAILGFAVATASGTTSKATALISLPLAELGSLLVVYGASRLPLRDETLVILGKLSYGIYLWHYPIARAFRGYYDWWVAVPFTIVLSVAAAAISYYTLEAVIRRGHARSGRAALEQKSHVGEGT